MLEPHWREEFWGKEQQKQDMATDITAKGTRGRRWERIFQKSEVGSKSNSPMGSAAAVSIRPRYQKAQWAVNSQAGS